MSTAFREANERIAEKAIALHFVARVPFVCECADPGCRDFVVLHAEEYRELRSEGRPVVLPGHGEGRETVFAS